MNRVSTKPGEDSTPFWRFRWSDELAEILNSSIRAVSYSTMGILETLVSDIVPIASSP